MQGSMFVCGCVRAFIRSFVRACVRGFSPVHMFCLNCNSCWKHLCNIINKMIECNNFHNLKPNIISFPFHSVLNQMGHYQCRYYVHIGTDFTCCGDEQFSSKASHLYVLVMEA